MAQATLIDKTGDPLSKVVVDVGSEQAQQYFGRGYVLMGAPAVPPAPNPNLDTRPRTGDSPADPSAGGAGTAPAAPGTTPPATPPAVVRYPLETTSDYDKRMAEFNANFKAPDEAAIRKKMQDEAQIRINGINQRYEGIFAQEAIAGEGRQGQTRALNSRNGVLGQDFGNQEKEKTTQYNKQIMDTYSQQKALEISAVFDKFDARAAEDIKTQRGEYLDAFKDNLDYLKERQDDARKDFETIAKSGLLKSLDQLSEEDMNNLLKQTGYSKMTLESVFNASKPKAQQIDYKTEKLGDGTLLFYGQDPITGEIVTKKFDFEVPSDKELKFATDGTPLIFDPKTGTAEVADGYKKGEAANTKLDSDMAKDGYSYVKTPAERDALKRQGYEIITTASGRTYAKPPAKKGGSGGGGKPVDPNKLTPEEKEFQTQLNKQKDALARGGSWGESFDIIKGRYPDITDAELDALLNKEKYYTQVGR